MMKIVPSYLRRRAPSLALLVLAACTPAAQSLRPLAERKTIVLISLDAFRRDLLDRYSAPALNSLAADGVVAAAMIPSFPTSTFPNHYTIVTGLYPEHHGIVANRFFDPDLNASFLYTSSAQVGESRWWGGEPIWVTAEKQGVKSASFFWVGSEAAIEGIRPSIYKTYSSKITFSQRVDSVLAWLTLPDALRPRMITLYFNEPDHTLHESGVDSPESRAVVLTVDSAVARLVSGLRAQRMYDAVDLIIVSDHGMANVSRDQYVYVGDVADTLNVHTVDKGPFFTGWATNGDNAGLVAALGKLPHVHAWLKADIPARLHYSDSKRISPVIAVADAGWMISITKPTRNTARAEHGYDNADPQMNALFLAHGPDFKHGARIPAFPNVDVYSLMTHILGLKPAPNDGSLGIIGQALR